MMGVRNEALLSWYAANRRALPWRSTEDPYATLVSEVMLQQTQVDRVIPKFEEFLRLWPTVESLAAAPRSEVVAAWSGLGYNSRAVRLHEAARRIVDDGWPDTLDGLLTLPGVGPYTARAIASIALGMDVAAVDTNLRRVLSRWEGEPLTGAAVDTVAARHLGSPAGDWNQAMMDLGATVCRPRDPNCGICPVVDWCRDPSQYLPPKRQTRFEGSVRQLRGAVLRAHVNGESVYSAGSALGRSAAEVDAVLADLADEGLIEDQTLEVVAG